MIIGLAGHVDHGKSALVTALTGIGTDRHPEERARGITIDMQAVPLKDANGEPVVALVDVPGHEDFVRTMIAGASGVGAVLLVIAADEGIMPQTREHLLIVERLGVPLGIPVITKIDAVEPEWAELVAGDVAQQLAASSIPFDAPILVSARSGAGVASLRDHLVHLGLSNTPADASDLFRLPVDENFSRPGIGAILTGTAWSGSVAIGDALRLLPGGDEVRVRSLETHGRAVDRASAGRRVAVGLAGLDREAVHRGDVLVHASAPWQLTSALDVELMLAPSVERALAARRRVRLHLGTAEIGARVMPRGSIAPGSTGLARVVLDHPVVARGGDRIVLRSWSPVATIGGGVVLDPLPPARATWPDNLTSDEPALRLQALVARRRFGLPIEDVPIVLGTPPVMVDTVVTQAGLVLLAGRLVLPGMLEELEGRTLALLAKHHAAEPGGPGLSAETLRRGLGGPDGWPERIVERLVGRGAMTIRDGIAALAGFTPKVDPAERLVPLVLKALITAGLEPPTGEELAKSLGEPYVPAALRLAEKRGLVEPIERGRWGVAEVLERFGALVSEVGGTGPITLAGMRDRTGLSRKFLIPLLEWADRRGITRRDGEARVLVRRPVT